MSIYQDPRWKRKKTTLGLIHNITLSKKLLEEGKITREFEDMLSNLTLEEIIALKLELSSKILHSTFIGAPLWYNLHLIVKDAVLKYAYSMANSASEAASLLGLPKYKFRGLLFKFRTENYFKTMIYRNKKKKTIDVVSFTDKETDIFP